jgi:hypothetical protein
MSFVPIGDDEMPVARETPAKAELRTALLASGAADRKNPNLSLVGKQRYANESEMEKARDLAGMYSSDPQFIAWASVENKAEAEQYIRDWIGGSRSLIATNTAVCRKFLDMELLFLRDVGRAPEIRA